MCLEGVWIMGVTYSPVGSSMEEFMAVRGWLEVVTGV